MKTWRQTVALIVTVLAAIVIAGVVQKSLGWLPGVMALVAVAVVGGLVMRLVARRELDRDIKEQKDAA